jgi:hypothetical protein
MEIGSSPAFCPLSTSLASDPSSQMSSPGWIRGVDQGAAAVPNAPMKHLGVLPAHKSRRRPSRTAWQSRQIEEMLARVPYITEPCHLINPPLRVGRRADRLLDLGSLGPAIHPPDWLRKGGGQSNRVLPYAQFRASPAGLSRSLTPRRTGDKTHRKVGNQGRQNERGNQSGEKQQCTRVARLYLE